jgi:dGTPase
MRPDDPDAVRSAPCLIGFSEIIKQEQQELKSFLRENLYRHFQVIRMSNKAQNTIKMLFNAFNSDIRLLPVAYQIKFSQYGHQAIADYIAGMTDRFAIKEYQRLFAINEN